MVEKSYCYRCKYEWYPRDPNKKSNICPRCKSKYWNQKEAPRIGRKPDKKE